MQMKTCIVLFQLKSVFFASSCVLRTTLELSNDASQILDTYVCQKSHKKDFFSKRTTSGSTEVTFLCRLQKTLTEGLKDFANKLLNINWASNFLF